MSQSKKRLYATVWLTMAIIMVLLSIVPAFRAFSVPLIFVCVAVAVLLLNNRGVYDDE